MQKFDDYTGKCKDGSDCELFLFSWTLTPTPTVPDPIPTLVVTLAMKANRQLGEVMTQATIPNAAGKFMNLLYVEYARVCDVALYEMDVPFA